jgi:hypothetical protein
VGAKTHGKMSIPTENYFSDGDRQKNTHGNRMTENLNFSVGSPSEKHISVGQALTEKIGFRRIKKQFSVCCYAQKKINTDRKISFFVGVDLSEKLGVLTEKLGAAKKQCYPNSKFLSPVPEFAY